MSITRIEGNFPGITDEGVIGSPTRPEIAPAVGSVAGTEIRIDWDSIPSAGVREIDGITD